MRTEHEPGLHDMLSALDPECIDPGYWHRLHRWAVNSAGPELARRRRLAAETVSDVVLSWWQTLVPIAALAAVAAAFLLMRYRPEAEPVAYMNVDEMLLEGNVAPVMPTFEMADGDGAIVLVHDAFSGP